MELYKEHYQYLQRAEDAEEQKMTGNKKHTSEYGPFINPAKMDPIHKKKFQAISSITGDLPTYLL